MPSPNFLFLLSDQHSPRFLHCAGNDVVRTPHMDALAARGIRFSNAYCAAPLCVPSRMTLMTSRYPSDIQVWTNGPGLRPEVPTFAHALSLAGYETTLCGRMHFVGADQRRGFQRRLVGDVSGAMERGFDWHAVFEGRIPTSTTGQSASALAAVGPGRTTYHAYDEAVTQRACRYLQERAQSEDEKPFCLVAGYVGPHNPYICPRSLFEEYMDRVTLPELPPDFPDALHPALRHLRQTRTMDSIAPEHARRALAAYYGLVTQLDQHIGRVLAALQSTPAARDTIVIYASDHGEMAGEQGLWAKETLHDASVGVPLIASWPEHFLEGATISQNVSLLDIGPTLLDFAGAPPLPNARGHSLRALLTAGADAHWPDEVFAETYAGGQRPARMIRSGDWKLNHYHGYDEPQLFNLQNDPLELHDLRDDPAQTERRAALTARLLQDWSGEEIENIAAGRALVERWQQEIAPGEAEVWRVPSGCNVFPES